MDKDQLIHEIGSSIVADIGARKNGWAHLVLVGTVEDDNPEMTGFAYFEDGRHDPVAPRDFSILEMLSELRGAMADADKKAPWITCLIHITRESGEIEFEFEYEKADRWAIRFANSKQRAEELNPVGRR